jgi:hypothetical protein
MYHEACLSPALVPDIHAASKGIEAPKRKRGSGPLHVALRQCPPLDSGSSVPTLQQQVDAAAFPPLARVGSTRARMFTDEVEIRFVPKAWAWPALGKTPKWAVGDFSRIVETASLSVVIAADETCHASAKHLPPSFCLSYRRTDLSGAVSPAGRWIRLPEAFCAGCLALI